MLSDLPYHQSVNAYCDMLSPHLVLLIEGVLALSSSIFPHRVGSHIQLKRSIILPDVTVTICEMDLYM